MSSAKLKALTIFLAVILLSFTLQKEKLFEDFELGQVEKMPSGESSGNANFSSSGESGVAISGEPSHVGDLLQASVLVSNSGNSTGLATLNLENLHDGETSQGGQVEISPGSTRELSAYFSPNNNGSNNYRWWVSASEGNETSSLTGEFSVQVSPKQTIHLTIDSYEWNVEDGLHVRISSTLTPGLSRNLILEASILHDGSQSILQTISLETDPGRREIELFLGQPQAEYIQIEAIPIGWSLSGDSVNLSMINVQIPIVDESSLTIEAEFTPQNPEQGTNVIATISLMNEGTLSTERGEIRIISSNDRTLIAETNVQSVAPGAMISTDVQIPSWPNEDRAELEIQWISGGVTSTVFLSIESNQGEGGANVPFDVLSAAYGVMGGILFILVGTLVWRGLSNRTPSTSETGLRETKEEKALKSRIDKREISCNFCEQRLMVPSDHSGGVKCPSCSMEFQVGNEQSEKDNHGKTSNDKVPNPIYPTSRSEEDNLNCPECEQALRVPLEKRPVMSRCPVCKTEFLAESSEV